MTFGGTEYRRVGFVSRTYKQPLENKEPKLNQATNNTHSSATSLGAHNAHKDPGNLEDYFCPVQLFIHKSTPALTPLYFIANRIMLL